MFCNSDQGRTVDLSKMTTSKMYWLPLLHVKAESKCIPRNLRSIRFLHLVNLIMQIFYKKLWYSFQPYFSANEDLQCNDRRCKIVKLASEFLIIKTLPLQLPKCVAYFGPAKVEGVFNVEESAVSGQGGVQLKWTGSLSSVKIHGKVVQVPFEIAFLGEQERGEEFTFTFLSSPSQKYSLLLVFISLLGTVACAQ
ncbi:hypothetical protein EGR_04602 [Echinococcus granulosus]|uniref:Uncharacterized protein n=1 Tax=Echinococcus granulosus TaxID=6210 RepID=W6UHQ6_ECHGR|nr:hypothetical protein EGR_04602 [Echinococcus granulosus]EUB60583.1 hypothetical protein EGR_04602 [Echinococcus granulosus]